MVKTVWNEIEKKYCVNDLVKICGWSGKVELEFHLGETNVLNKVIKILNKFTLFEATSISP